MTLKLVVNASSKGGRLMAGFSIAEGDGPRPMTLVTSEYATAEVADPAFWEHPRAMAAAPELMNGLEAAIAEIERLSTLSGQQSWILESLQQTLGKAKEFPLNFIDRHDQKVFAALLRGEVVWSKVGERSWHTTPRGDGVVGIVKEKDGSFSGFTMTGFSALSEPMWEPQVFSSLDEAKRAVAAAMALPVNRIENSGLEV